jgi:hypothetical protein
VSALDPVMRELVAFAGPVQCERFPGAINLVLRGHERAPSESNAGVTEVLFSDASDVALPPDLRDLRVMEVPAAVAPRRFRIDGPGLQLELQARSAQLHSDAAAAFYGAVPPPRVPLRLRLGWSLLLSVLRIPGADTLVRKLRGST